jgi:hypothetical protein
MAIASSERKVGQQRAAYQVNSQIEPVALFPISRWTAVVAGPFA